MNNANIPKSAERIEQERSLIVFCGNVLKKIMIDHGIDNKMLAARAGVHPSQISRLRNGTLNQRNYIIDIRGLPEPARREYIEQVYFGDIPARLSPEIREKIARKVAKRQQKQGENN